MRRRCQDAGCEREAKVKGWCRKHYAKNSRQEAKGTSGCIALRRDYIENHPAATQEWERKYKQEHREHVQHRERIIRLQEAREEQEVRVLRVHFIGWVLTHLVGCTSGACG